MPYSFKSLWLNEAAIHDVKCQREETLGPIRKNWNPLQYGVFKDKMGCQMKKWDLHVYGGIMELACITS